MQDRESQQQPLPFDDSASALMLGARLASNRLNHTRVGTAHLLLSFCETENPYLKKLAEVGLHFQKVSQAVELFVGTGGQPLNGENVASSRLKKILDGAQERARREGKLHVTASHLFLMLVSEKDGYVAAIFEELGVEKHKLLRAMQPQQNRPS